MLTAVSVVSKPVQGTDAKPLGPRGKGSGATPRQWLPVRMHVSFGPRPVEDSHLHTALIRVQDDPEMLGLQGFYVVRPMVHTIPCGGSKQSTGPIGAPMQVRYIKEDQSSALLGVLFQSRSYWFWAVVDILRTGGFPASLQAMPRAIRRTKLRAPPPGRSLPSQALPER